MSIENTSPGASHQKSIYMQPLPPKTNISDFRGKLELNKPPAEVTAISGADSKVAMEGRNSAGKREGENIYASDSAVHDIAGLTSINNGSQLSGSSSEFHPLRLTAGRHLSYVTHDYIEDPKVAESHLLVEKRPVTHSVVLDALHGLEGNLSKTEAGQVGRLFEVSSNSKSADMQSAEALNEWILFAKLRWPIRRISVTQRENDLEILIRDYHLTAADKKSLVQEMLVRWPALAAGSLRIRINGELVWSRASGRNLQQGGVNGD